MAPQSDKLKKAWYYFDELIVYFVMFIAIVFSDAVMKMIKDGTVTPHEFALNWVKVIASCLIAILALGTMNDSFIYSDKKKPPLAKRIYNAVLHGIAYKSLIGVTSDT